MFMKIRYGVLITALVVSAGLNVALSSMVQHQAPAKAETSGLRVEDIPSVHIPSPRDPARIVEAAKRVTAQVAKPERLRIRNVSTDQGAAISLQFDVDYSASARRLVANANAQADTLVRAVAKVCPDLKRLEITGVAGSSEILKGAFDQVGLSATTGYPGQPVQVFAVFWNTELAVKAIQDK